MVRDPHSYGNSNEVCPSHLALELTLDFTQRRIDGRCDLTLVWSQPDVTHVDLDTRDLTITAVTDGEARPLHYELGTPHPFMGSRLRVHLPQRQEAIRIVYHTHPDAAALQWLTPAQTTSQRLPFLFTQSQAILARTWIPCMDSPGVRTTYDAVVHAPSGMTAVMGAHAETHEPEQGRFRFTMPYAIPAYLIALAAGELAFQSISDRTGVYAEPAVLDRATWECDDMDRMIQAAETLYGPYRWGRWDTIILPPSFPFGGMENPMLTFATPTILAGDRSLVSLMAHELAHSWSGNLVTNATWGDFWLNEGFTTYFERRIVEALYGHDLAEMQWLLGQRTLAHTIDRLTPIEPEFTKLRMNLDDRDPDDAFSELPYEKGANFLCVLENHFGRPTFDAFLQQYFEEHAFESMTTSRFLELIRNRLFDGDATAWDALHINDWIYQPGAPNNMIIPTSDHFECTRAAADTFINVNRLPTPASDAWTTAEWLDFLQSLPEIVALDKLQQLDHAFHFSQSGNAEILYAWLAVCIRNTYEPAFPVVEDFLCRQGRRKFLQPLYSALWANPRSRDLAVAIYRQARPGYHPIAVATIDSIVALSDN
ncbi:aminopeptidase [Candidatus Entotheonella serta]|nr:aminopeptidase [Candidatus Entotheonella serta]